MGRTNLITNFPVPTYINNSDADLEETVPAFGFRIVNLTKKIELVFSEDLRDDSGLSESGFFTRSSFQNRAGKQVQIFEENLRSGDFSLLLSLHGRQRK